MISSTFAYMQDSKHTRRMSIHFLISGTRGLNLDCSCVITSSINATCFITLRVFMIRTIAACIKYFRSSSIVLCVSSVSTFCSVFICKLRLMRTFLLQRNVSMYVLIQLYLCRRLIPLKVHVEIIARSVVAYFLTLSEQQNFCLNENTQRRVQCFW